ncbi:MAG: DEAD/DEAH box helicase [Bdellovibrionales bacterium]|nr:DEAD/DEAH box helicase [Bdellovibrionales bacterium]
MVGTDSHVDAGAQSEAEVSRPEVVEPTSEASLGRKLSNFLTVFNCQAPEKRLTSSFLAGKRIRFEGEEWLPCSEVIDAAKREVWPEGPPSPYLRPFEASLHDAACSTNALQRLIEQETGVRPFVELGCPPWKSLVSASGDLRQIERLLAQVLCHAFDNRVEDFTVQQIEELEFRLGDSEKLVSGKKILELHRFALFKANTDEEGDFHHSRYARLQPQMDELGYSKERCLKDFIYRRVHRNTPIDTDGFDPQWPIPFENWLLKDDESGGFTSGCLLKILQVAVNKYLRSPEELELRHIESALIVFPDETVLPGRDILADFARGKFRKEHCELKLPEELFQSQGFTPKELVDEIRTALCHFRKDAIVIPALDDVQAQTGVVRERNVQRELKTVESWQGLRPLLDNVFEQIVDRAFDGDVTRLTPGRVSSLLLADSMGYAIEGSKLLTLYSKSHFAARSDEHPRSYITTSNPNYSNSHLLARMRYQIDPARSGVTIVTCDREFVGKTNAEEAADVLEEAILSYVSSAEGGKGKLSFSQTNKTLFRFSNDTELWGPEILDAYLSCHYYSTNPDGDFYEWLKTQQNGKWKSTPAIAIERLRSTYSHLIDDTSKRAGQSSIPESITAVSIRIEGEAPNFRENPQQALQAYGRALGKVFEELGQSKIGMLTQTELRKVQVRIELEQKQDSPQRFRGFTLTGLELLDRYRATLARANDPDRTYWPDKQIIAAAPNVLGRVEALHHVQSYFGASQPLVEHQELLEAASLLYRDPLRLHQYLRICHPEIELSEGTQLLRQLLKGFSKAEAKHQYESFEVTLEPVTLQTPADSLTSTAQDIFEVKGRVSKDAVVVWISGDYNKMVRVKSDGSFQSKLPLRHKGELNSFEIFAVDPFLEKRSEGIQIRVQHLGATMSTGEAYLDLLSRRNQLIEDVTKDPVRRAFLARSVELSSLLQFTEDERAGLQWLRRRIDHEHSPVLKKVLEGVERKFTDVCEYEGILAGGRRLYFYQKYALFELEILRAAGKPGHVLSFEQGLGKTLVALKLSEHEPTTVVAPSAVVSNWAAEESKFIAEPSLHVLTGSYRSRDRQLQEDTPDRAVTNVEFMRAMTIFRKQSLDRPQGTVILDESDVLGSRTSQQTRGLKQLEGQFKLLLSGTPFRKPTQFASTLEYLYPSEPMYKSARAFEKAFNPHSEDGLRALSQLVYEHTLRVRKSDVFRTYDRGIPLEEQKDRLPEKVRVSPEQYGRYRLSQAQVESILELFSDYYGWCARHRNEHAITDEDSQFQFSREGFFSKREALRQIQNDPSYIGLAEPSPKHLEMDRIVQGELTENAENKVLIFCRYKAQVAEYLNRYAKYGARRYDGSVPASYSGYRLTESGDIARYRTDARGNYLLDEFGFPILTKEANGTTMRALDYELMVFQNDPQSRLLVMTYDTGSVGVTATAATAVIFDDLAASYRDEYQAADRAHRIDNDRARYEVRYYNMQASYPDEVLNTFDEEIVEQYFSMGTYDEVFLENLRYQERIFHRVLDGVGDEEELAALQESLQTKMPFLFESLSADGENRLPRFSDGTAPASSLRESSSSVLAKEGPSKGPLEKSGAIEQLRVQRNEPVILDIQRFLIEHDGPDLQGRFHDDLTTVSVEVLDEALRRAHGSDRALKFEPYHFHGVRGVAESQTVVDRILKRKLGLVLEYGYRGDLVRMVRDSTLSELIAPLNDRIKSDVYTVSLAPVRARLGYGRAPLMRRFCQLLDREAEVEEDLRSIESREQRLVQGCDSLIKEKYRGDLGLFFASTNFAELTEAVPEHHCQNAWEIVSEFLQQTGRGKDVPELSRYHLGCEAYAVAQDALFRDALLKNKFQQVLAESFDGDVLKFAAEVEIEELSQPWSDSLFGKPFEVSMEKVIEPFQGELFELLQHGCRISEIEFPFTSACFEGGPVRRRQRIYGLLDAEDFRILKSSDGTRYDFEKFGFSQCESNGKREVRQRISRLVKSELGKVPVLALEQPQFRFFETLSRDGCLESESSVVVEMDTRVANCMRSIQLERPEPLIHSVDGIRIVSGRIEDFLDKTEQKFGLVFLDFCGQMCRVYDIALHRLLTREVLLDKSLFFINVSDRELDRVRSQSMGFAPDPLDSVTASVKQALPHGRSAELVFDYRYQGGVSNRKGADMRTLGFRFLR